MAESTTPYARRLDLIRRRYPRGAILRDARKLELRLMSGEDRSAILEFARSLSDDDLLFLDENIREEPVVEGWVEAVESGSPMIHSCGPGARGRWTGSVLLNNTHGRVRGRRRSF